MARDLVSRRPPTRPGQARREMLPGAPPLLFPIDAADYVTAALERDPTGSPVPECHSYQAFRQLLAGTAWRDEINAFS